MDLGVVPSPKTIIKDLYKVKPGEVIKFKIQNEKFIKEDFDYWNIEDFVGEEKFESEKF